MKKIFVACFFAILMLLVPISTVGKTIDNNKNILHVNEDPPEIYMTVGEYTILGEYIDNNFDENEAEQAEIILNDITNYDAENQLYMIDVNKLADALDDYTLIQPIPDGFLTEDNIKTKDDLLDLINEYWVPNNSPFNDFIKKIIDLIKLRLGWMYDLFSKGGELFTNGVTLAKNFINLLQNIEWALIFATLFNLIVSVPLLYFSETIRLLFILDFDGFIQKISDFAGVFTEELNEAFDFIDSILEPFGPAFDEIKDYVDEIEDFIKWIRGEQPYTKLPWEKEITVKGVAKTLFYEQPYVGAEVTCRGVTALTDSQGGFEFTVEPSDDSADSKPENSWYGLHNCVITLSKGEVVKQTPVKLSYVFSGGTMEWTFHILKARSKVTDFRTVLMEKFYNFMVWMQNLFPNFFRQINRINALAI